MDPVRKWKKKSSLGKEGKWEFEIGEDVRPVNLDLENITESRGNVSYWQLSWIFFNNKALSLGV